MIGNGHEAEKRVKKCPFLGEWCIGDSCAIWVEVRQVGVGQLGQKVIAEAGMCGIPALCMISSTRQVPQPQRINLPPIGRG